MKLKGRKIGVAITGSFCTYEKVFQALRALKKEEAELQTIFSDAAQSIDSRFGNAEEFVTKAKEITGAKPSRRYAALRLSIPSSMRSRSDRKAFWIC